MASYIVGDLVEQFEQALRHVENLAASRRRSQRVMGRRDATAERAVTKKKRAQRRARL
jgi:hypothetical protein